jgi:predicted methyltransferase
MARQLGGCTFDCSLQDMVARNVFFAGCTAAQEIAFVRGVLKPGMNFVDVGANWGLFTLVAARSVGSAGRVVALEPDPRVLAKLKANVRRNELSQVKVLAVAAADCDSNLLLAAHDHTAENLGHLQADRKRFRRSKYVHRSLATA